MTTTQLSPRPLATDDEVVARLVGVGMRRGGKCVLEHVDLTVRRGRMLAVLGASGAGKSTILDILAGELTPTEGRLDTGNARLTRGVVHQAPLLFPWLTVVENVRIGQTYSAHRDTRDELVDEMIQLLGLDGVRGHYPDQLSGGQAQRTSLARALAVDPDLVLLDEPFSALDPHARGQLQTWVRDQVHSHGWTGVIVTHDVDEALILADEIVVLGSAGRVTASFEHTPCEPDTVRASPLRTHILAAYHAEAPDA